MGNRIQSAIGFDWTDVKTFFSDNKDTSMVRRLRKWIPWFAVGGVCLLVFLLHLFIEVVLTRGDCSLKTEPSTIHCVRIRYEHSLHHILNSCANKPEEPNAELAKECENHQHETRWPMWVKYASAFWVHAITDASWLLVVVCVIGILLWLLSFKYGIMDLFREMRAHKERTANMIHWDPLPTNTKYLDGDSTLMRRTTPLLVDVQSTAYP